MFFKSNFENQMCSCHVHSFFNDDRGWNNDKNGNYHFLRITQDRIMFAKFKFSQI